MVGLLFTFLQPFDFFERTFRFELLYTIFQTVIAPFGRFSMRETFLGDILTSMTRPLTDFAYLILFFSYQRLGDDNEAQDAMWHNSEGTLKDLKPSWILVLVISLLPLNFRFWACISKVYCTGEAYPNIYNAGKYFSGMVSVVVGTLFALGFVPKEAAIGVAAFSTCYSLFWDLYFDWGLLRCDGEHMLLRKHLSYPPWVYYLCAFLNAALRFAWLIPKYVSTKQFS